MTTTVRTASRETFAISHLVLILFHFTIACLLIFNRRLLMGDVRKKIFWIGICLVIATILAVLPVYLYYRHNAQYVINMETL